MKEKLFIFFYHWGIIMISDEILAHNRKKHMVDITNSMKLWNSAIDLIPRGTQTMSKAPDQFVFGATPIYIERGQGCRVRDVDGNWYIDYPCALGPIILGHNHRRTVDAITKQVSKGIIFSLMSPVEVELAELLVEIIPCAEQVRYAKNGSDATLAAVRLARSHSGKEVILKPRTHYHGWNDWIAASTTRDFGVPKSLKDIIRTFEYNDLESLKIQLDRGDVAAVIMEPMALENPNPGFLEGVRELCTESGVILIFDEMITGFRWALGGAQEYYGVIPDIATFGKAVANGMPLAIIAGKREFMKEFDHIFFSMTFGGEAVSIAAAVETVKELIEKREDIFPHIWRNGNKLQTAFNEFSGSIGLDAKMIGAAPRSNIIFNVEDPGGAKDIFNQEMVKRGILMGSQTYITWAHNDEDIDETIVAIKESLIIVKMAVDEDNVDSVIEGARSLSTFKKSINKDKSL